MRTWQAILASQPQSCLKHGLLWRISSPCGSRWDRCHQREASAIRLGDRAHPSSSRPGKRQVKPACLCPRTCISVATIFLRPAKPRGIVRVRRTAVGVSCVAWHWRIFVSVRDKSTVLPQNRMGATFEHRLSCPLGCPHLIVDVNGQQSHLWTQIPLYQRALSSIADAAGLWWIWGWWPETGSNRRRRPFQGRALPLSYLASGKPRTLLPLKLCLSLQLQAERPARSATAHKQQTSV